MKLAQQWIWYISVGAQVAVFLRLLLSGLGRSYAWFLAFCGLGVAISIIRLPVSPASDEYMYLWLVTEPVIAFLQFGAGFEAFRLTTRTYPNIGRFGLLILIAGAIAAIGVSAGLYSLESASEGAWGNALRATLLARRTLSSLLAMFLVVAELFFAFAPIPVSRNLKLHRRLLIVYFAVMTAGQFATNVLGPGSIVALNAATLAGLAACSMVWVIGLSREGEQKPDFSISQEEAEEAERMAAELLGFVKAAKRR